MKTCLLVFLTVAFAACDNSATVKVNLDSTANEIKNSKILDSVGEKGSRILDSVKTKGAEVWDSSKAKGGRFVERAEKEINGLKKNDSVR